MWVSVSKYAIAFFVVAGLVLLITPHPWWPSFYDLPYMGIAALVCAGLVWIVPDQFKTPLAIILLLNASGDLGLYELYRFGFQYDKIIHLTSSLIATLVLARVLGFRRAALIVIAAGIAWELFEFVMDRYFKTRLFGVYHLFVWQDTMVDAVCNLMGVAAAAAYRGMQLKSNQKSGTVS